MYTTGWGFQTNLGLLVKAAHTWQAVRLLRLVRNKHEQHLALGTARVNLASLPPEIMRLIETEVISAAECELYTNEPFYFDRDCCFESVCDMKLKDNWYYLQFVDFAVENGYDLDDEDERLTAGLAFDTSPAGQAIEQDLYDEHWSSGECEELQATSDFWASIAEGLNYCSPKDQIHDLVDSFTDEIEVLISDFNLVLYRRTDKSFGYDETSPLTLLFDGTIREHGRLTRSYSLPVTHGIKFVAMERACRLEALRWLCDIDDDTDFGSSGRKSSLKWITLEEVIEDDESFPSHDVVDIKSPPSSSL